MDYIATFFTHFGALSFKKRLEKMGDSPVMQPVPRALSASCGTCVRFAMTFHADTMADDDVEEVYRTDAAGCRRIYRCEE